MTTVSLCPHMVLSRQANLCVAAVAVGVLLDCVAS